MGWHAAAPERIGLVGAAVDGAEVGCAGGVSVAVAVGVKLGVGVGVAVAVGVIVGVGEAGTVFGTNAVGVGALGVGGRGPPEASTLCRTTIKR